MLECPEFEYDKHPRRPYLAASVQKIIRDLRTGQVLVAALASDTRPSHEQLFHDMTPPTCPYYAGHYRGELFPCLLDYRAGVAGDERVGAEPWLVVGLMGQLAERIRRGLDALDAFHARNDISDRNKILASVQLACGVFDSFLAIHPYANGNGHIARLIVWALLGRHGYWPHRWTIEPRPDDPPYTPFLVAHRDGNRSPLQRWILGFILGDK